MWRKRAGAFVLWKQRRQSPSTDKNQSACGCTTSIERVCVCVCVRVLQRTLGDYHTSWILFSPEIPEEDKQTKTHTEIHTHVCMHTCGCEGSVNTPQSKVVKRNRLLWGGGGGGGGGGGEGSQGRKFLERSWERLNKHGMLEEWEGGVIMEKNKTHTGRENR